MEQYYSYKIQIISIVVSLGFLLYVSRLIIKGKLREEYAIFWVISTILLIIFSFWREGLDIIAKAVGVYLAPNLVFTSAIFAILIYLLHLSIVVSQLHDKNKTLTQDLALFKERISKLEEKLKEK
ncbi:MAG: DUF2304 domain-containing protein [Bacteroidetes bacterium]|nr:MAG: DUF2304 domain-containing protein [Bacteroidota bacterium]